MAGFSIACPELVEGKPKIMTKHKKHINRFTLWNSFQIPQGKQNYKQMNSKLILIFSFPVVMMMSAGCSNKPASTNDTSAKDKAPKGLEVPATPAPSTFLKIAEFVSPQEMDSIISQKTTLSDKKVRMKGIAPVPQNGDDFRRANLDGVYWHNVSVAEGDFRGASMRSVKAEESIFQNSDFRVADIRWTLFNSSIMAHCNFNQAKLFHVHVNFTNLNNSTFRGANMFGMEGHHAQMKHCDMTNALMKDSEFTDTDFTGSLFVHTRLIRAVMTGSTFDYVNCTDADFSGGNLDNASFRNANCTRANFQGNGMKNTDFSGSDLSGCNFFGARLKTVNFKDAKNIPDNVRKLIVNDTVTANILER